MNARFALLAVLALHCAHAPARVRAASTSSAPPVTRVAATPATVESGPSARGGAHPVTCPPHVDNRLADLPDFTPDDHALRLDGASAAPDGGEPLREGHLVVPIPAAWFPARVDGDGAVSYRVRTAFDDDVIGLYFGDVPAFHVRSEGAFRRRQGPLAIRGNVWDEPSGEHRLEALVRIPCGTPQWVHVYAGTTHDETLRRVISLLTGIVWSDTAAASLHEVPLDATRDAAALDGFTAGDATARALARRALAGEGLRARYPLTVRHPRADQMLTGRFVEPLGGVPVETWVSLAVHDGRATAAHALSARFDGSLSRALAAIPPSACHPQAVMVSAEWLGLRCTTGPDVRALVDDPTAPDALPLALHRALHVRAVLARWSGDPSMGFGYPASLCTPAAVRVSAEGPTLQVTGGSSCALAVDATHDTLRAVSLQGSCASVPADGWGRAVRTVGRFDEVRGEHGTDCTFTLGALPHAAWVIAVGDEGTASGPIATGPRFAVDPHAVQTAVAFAHDLVAFATGQSDETPANVRPTVLHALGVDRPGSPESVATVRLFFARGGFEGAPLSSVLAARARDDTHVQVTLLPVTLELEAQPVGWVVTEVRPTEL